MKQNRHLLIVDDEDEILNLLADVLSEEGYSVRTARSGDAALRTIRQQPPDLVLLDYSLPDMTGADILRKLSEHQQIDYPVIMMSAGTRTGALDLPGVVEFIPKPFDLLAVIRCVEQLTRS